MEKHGLAKFGQLLGNLSAGKIADYKYCRQKIVRWDLSQKSKWILKNVNIADVDIGRIHEEKAILY